MKFVSQRQKSSGKRIFLCLFLSCSILGVASYFSSPFTFFPSHISFENPPDTNTLKKKPRIDTTFRSTLRNADNLFAQKQYDLALPEYEKALKLAPNDAVVKDKINKVKSIIADQKKALEDYQKYIVSADNYFKAKDWLNAKAAYQQAIDLKPDDQYAKDKLKETMDYLRSQKATNILYDVAIESAEQLFRAKEYEKAKTEYEKASKVLPNDAYAKERINACIKIMIDNQTREESYANAIASADKFYAAKNFRGALTDYKDASSIKPNEKYPKDRIAELTDLLKAQKERDDAYNKALAKADSLYKILSYLPAKTGYQNASKIEPEQEYPKNRIKEIDDYLAHRSKTDNEYSRLISVADSYYIDRNFISAKANYQQALTVKPNEAYPKDMIAKSDNQIAGLEANAKSIEESYKSAITGADKLFADKSYDRARSEYQNASNIKPSEQYPKDKIAAIDAIFALAEKDKALHEKYQAAITTADKLFSDKSYDQAKTGYQEALTLIPTEEYPKTKIGEIDKILGEKEKSKALETQYADLITKGDQLLGAKNYDQAKVQYTQALQIKPNEQYPKDKLTEIDKALGDLAALKALDDQYKASITKADKLFSDKSYDDAKTEYTVAGKLKPQEQYPKDKIAEIDKALAAIADQRSKEEQYTASIGKADKLLADKSYEPAKTEYQNAGTIKPQEQYPKQKIAEIDKILDDIAKQKSLEDQYKSLIANGDKLLSDKSYNDAKVQYQSALKLKPDEKYPSDKIAEIDLALAAIAKQKSMEDQYQALIKTADDLLATKVYDQARAKYTDAGNLKPAEKYPKDKIAEIDKILNDLAQQKALDEKYQGTIANADKLFAAKTYDQARSEYMNASSLKPSEQYPKDKLAEIDKIYASIADQKAKDDQYKASIEKADKLLADKTYDQARSEYQSAGSIKPSEAYPKQKIAEIDDILAGIAKQKALDDQYAGTLANADKLLQQKSYDEAKTQYQAASALKPGEKYPKDKIAEIDLALTDLAKQKSLDDQYQGLIKSADVLFAAKTWDQARGKYTDAGKLKPAEQYPKDKIAEIDKILDGIAQQKALDEKYQGMIANADKLLAAKSYDQSRSEYMNASSLKPAEQYPKDKITEIDKTLASIADQKAKDDQYKAAIDKADKLLADKTYDQAKSEYQGASAIKPAEQYPKQKITEIDNILADIAKQKALDDQYTGILANADKLLEQKSYDPAKTQYLAASALKPAEKYPKDKIAQIDLALADIAKLKALDDQYKASIAKADQLLNDKSYEPAKAEYTNASRMKPGEQYPKDKMAEIDKTLADIAATKALDEKYKGIITNADRLMAAKTFDQARTEYTNAATVKPAEQYPKDKIAEIEKILADIAHHKEVDEQYQASIFKANQLFTSKSYEQAKTEYTNASTLKPAEEYPKTKLAEIEKIFADQKALEDRYAASIAKADKLMGDKSYDLAKQEYLAAGSLKPGEKYPKDKLAEIDKTVAEAAKQKSLEDQYKNIISQADNLLQEKSYERAKSEYTNALTIRPNEQYPKDKMAEIETLLAELKAKDDSYKASIAKADQLLLKKSFDEAKTEYQNAISIKPSETYPKDKIAEINTTLSELLGKKKLFDDLVQKGDDFYARKDIYQAKDQYQQSLTIFPDEAYPKQRIARINVAIDSLYRANKGLYDKAISDADKYYNTLIFDKAIDSYSDALGFLPMEAYPKEMIAKIKKSIAENAIVDVMKTPVIVTSGNDKQFSFVPVTMASRKNNYFYVKIKNLSDKPLNVLIRYGKDKQTSGGAVIKNLSADGKINDRLVSVRDQDPWYREDNNWISIAPQGGDVEISFIQISRAQ